MTIIRRSLYYSLALLLLLLITSIQLSESLAFANPALWAVRAASAVFSYVGLVAVLDGPQGELNEDVAPFLRIAPSQVEGAGLGLYVTQSLPKATILGTYPGVVLSPNQNYAKLKAHQQCEAYIWRFGDSQMVIDPTDALGNIQDYCVGGNPSTPGSLMLCQTLLAEFLKKPTTLCRINEPPIGKGVNVVTDEDSKRRSVQFVLDRDVYANEELFMDYGITYDRSFYGGATKSDES